MHVQWVKHDVADYVRPATGTVERVKILAVRAETDGVIVERLEDTRAGMAGELTVVSSDTLCHTDGGVHTYDATRIPRVYGSWPDARDNAWDA